eukprot:731621-Prymnesium_polylepis.1
MSGLACASRASTRVAAAGSRTTAAHSCTCASWPTAAAWTAGRRAVRVPTREPCCSRACRSS